MIDWQVAPATRSERRITAAYPPTCEHLRRQVRAQGRERVDLCAVARDRLCFRDRHRSCLAYLAQPVLLPGLPVSSESPRETQRLCGFPLVWTRHHTQLTSPYAPYCRVVGIKP